MSYGGQDVWCLTWETQFTTIFFCLVVILFKSIRVCQSAPQFWCLVGSFQFPIFLLRFLLLPRPLSHPVTSTMSCAVGEKLLCVFFNHRLLILLVKLMNSNYSFSASTGYGNRDQNLFKKWFQSLATFRNPIWDSDRKTPSWSPKMFL